MAITNVRWNGWCYKTDSENGKYAAVCVVTPFVVWPNVYILPSCPDLPVNNLTTSLTLYTQNWAVNPDTGAAWTLASIKDCFWGVGLWKSLTGTSNCDQFWLTVTQTEEPNNFNLFPISDGVQSGNVVIDYSTTNYTKVRDKDAIDVTYTQHGSWTCPEGLGYYYFRVGVFVRTRAYIIDWYGML